MPPQTRYAKHGDQNIAFQEVGEGDVEVVFVPSFVSHVEFYWADPAIKAFLDQLSAFCRLVIFDKLGTGLSDPVNGIPTLEERAEEIGAVIEAAGFERPALFGLSEGGPSSIFYTATHPGRVRALVLFGTFFSGAIPLAESAEDAQAFFAERGFEPEFIPNEEQLARVREFRRHVFENWGEGKALSLMVPSAGNAQQLAMMERLTASPGMARATLESGYRLDVSDLLESIQVPTLVVHAEDDLVPIQVGRLLADRIPGARMLEVEGRDHAPWLSDPDRIAGEVEEFLTGTRHAAEPDRVLATVLFTDIVSSTERAAELGDARWRAVLERHDELTRAAVERFDGRAVKSTGDGFLAVFDGPARAIRCAVELTESLGGVGIEIRAGLHTGECEVIGEDVGGLAVHIAARVNAQAAPGEILASRTVRDLVVGSGTHFADRGEHELKGVPGSWQLLAVAPRAEAAPDSDAQIVEIDTPGPRERMRVGDRVAATMARRTPGLLRTLVRVGSARQ